MHSDLFVSPNAESSDSVSSLGLNWLLLSEILNNLGGLGELITRLSSTEIQNEFVNLDVSHLVVVLLLLLVKVTHIFFLSKPTKLINNRIRI